MLPGDVKPLEMFIGDPVLLWDWITVHENYTSPKQCFANYNPSPGVCGTSPTCLPLNITLTPQGQRAEIQKWIQGRTWGIRWYHTGVDLGATFGIRLKVENSPGQPVGPNQVLPDQGLPVSPVRYLSTTLGYKSPPVSSASLSALPNMG